MNYEFDFEGQHYKASIQHFDYLTPEEINQYRVTENTFLVFPDTATTQKVFELFNEAGDLTMQWKTHSDLYADPRICEMIGRHIEDVSK